MNEDEEDKEEEEEDDDENLGGQQDNGRLSMSYLYRACLSYSITYVIKLSPHYSLHS